MKYLRSILTIVFLATPLYAFAQGPATKSTRILVGTPAGTQPDLVARVLAKQLAVTMGQQFIIENVSGSGGISAITTLIGAKPDGLTLMLINPGHWAVNPVSRSNLPYDPVKSFTPVGMVATSSLFLAVNDSIPAKNLTELVAALRAKPGVYSYGSSGVGSIHQLTMEAFKQHLKVDILHVPYKGSSEAVPALIGGQVNMVVSAFSSLEPYAKAGRIRILAANTLARSPSAPEIPSMSEVVPGLDFPPPHGLVGPPGMPKEVVDRLAAGLRDAMALPETAGLFKAIDVEPVEKGGPDALARRIQDDLVKYRNLFRAAKIPMNQ
jgi:tripartite-type tricarboxylate transporter receptor subunit TctC